MPDEETGFAAFWAKLTPDQSAALLEISGQLHGIGERGLFAAFLMKQDKAQQGPMLDLLSDMTTEERLSFAVALHVNAPEKWSAVSRFRS